jgi:hypothetical protein
MYAPAVLHLDSSVSIAAEGSIALIADHATVDAGPGTVITIGNGAAISLTGDQTVFNAGSSTILFGDNGTIVADGLYREFEGGSGTVTFGDYGSIDVFNQGSFVAGNSVDFGDNGSISVDVYVVKSAAVDTLLFGGQFAAGNSVTFGANGSIRVVGGSYLGEGDLTFGPNGSIYVGVEWGDFWDDSGTVTFENGGVIDGHLGPDTGIFFNNLTTSGLLTVAEDCRGTCTGAVTNNGIIRTEGDVTGTGGWGHHPLTGARLDVTVQGTLSHIRIDRIDTNHPNAGPAQETGRYWEITPTGSGYTTDVQLVHDLGADHDYAEVCRYIGGGSWDCARTSSTTTSVTLEGVTELSDWAVGDSRLPVEHWELYFR